LKDKDMAGFVCSPDVKLGNPAVLISGNDNRLYGTTFGGFGGVFRMDGTKATALHEFAYTDGSKPLDLIQGSDGNLYGTTINGGSVNYGVVYRLSPQTQAFDVLYQFVPKFLPAPRRISVDDQSRAGVLESGLAVQTDVPDPRS
jgi:uncharacterized repeat protein (TIGR03803 family)